MREEEEVVCCPFRTSEVVFFCPLSLGGAALWVKLHPRLVHVMRLDNSVFSKFFFFFFKSTSKCVCVCSDSRRGCWIFCVVLIRRVCD